MVCVAFENPYKKILLLDTYIVHVYGMMYDVKLIYVTGSSKIQTLCHIAIK